MSTTSNKMIACACGQTRMEITGSPIVSAECCCNSCREAASRLQTLPSAPAFIESNGYTRYVLYRKDRVRFVSGAENFKEFRLNPKSQSRRIVACCCNTPVFLELKGGHWLSLYSVLWPVSSRPPIDLRTMVSDLPSGTQLPNDVPNAGTQTFGFYMKLLGAWIAMKFKSPKISTQGEIHA